MSWLMNEKSTSAGDVMTTPGVRRSEMLALRTPCRGPGAIPQDLSSHKPVSRQFQLSKCVTSCGLWGGRKIILTPGLLRG